jgi:hypothetical protein
LRRATSDFSVPSAETEWAPVTVRGADLRLDDIGSWAGKELGLEFKSIESEITVVEIGQPAAPAGEPGKTQPRPVAPASNPGHDSSPPAAGSSRPANRDSNPLGDDLAPGHRTNTRLSWDFHAPRTISEMLWDGVLLATSPARISPRITRNASSKPAEFFGRDAGEDSGLSRRLIWPAMDGSTAEEETPYVIANPAPLPIETIWSGYTREGDLVGQYAVRLEGSSVSELLPFWDLPPRLGAGGHWETTSDFPIIGTGDGAGFGMPVASERLVRKLSFPAVWLNQGVHAWFVNPGESPVVVSLTVQRGDKILAGQIITVPAHGGITWPDINSGTGPVAGASVVARAVDAALAMGLALGQK